MNYYVIVSQNGNPANFYPFTEGSAEKNKKMLTPCTIQNLGIVTQTAHGQRRLSLMQTIVRLNTIFTSRKPSNVNNRTLYLFQLHSGIISKSKGEMK